MQPVIQVKGLQSPQMPFLFAPLFWSIVSAQPPTPMPHRILLSYSAIFGAFQDAFIYLRRIRIDPRCFADILSGPHLSWYGLQRFG